MFCVCKAINTFVHQARFGGYRGAWLECQLRKNPLWPNWGATILKSRVELVVAEGFKTANNALVLENPSNYFINNFFSATSNDYTGFGHFTGAYRVNPLLLSDNTYQHIDPVAGAKVVTYCYTGQTSAVMTAWLRVLGYDAYSLSFGMNGLYHSSDNWKSNQWGVGSSVPKDLPFAQ